MRLALAPLLAVAAAGAIPLPTPAQLKWQQGEIMALIHFNMATFVRVSGKPAATAGGAAPRDASSSGAARDNSRSVAAARTPQQDGDPGCNKDNWNGGLNSSDPGTFWPYKLNVSNWIESFNELNIRHGVLTAKHGSGGRR